MKKRIIIILSIFSVIELALFIFILFTSRNIIRFDPTYIGFNNFQEIFSFPINFAIGFITIAGAILAFIKFSEDNKNFKEQLKLNKDNIYINNYFNIKNEFINYLKNYIDNLKQSDINHLLFGNITIGESQSLDSCKYETISKINYDFLSDIFQFWYGDLYKSTLRIEKTVLDDVTNIFKNYLEKFNKFPDVDIFLFDRIYPEFDKLGFRKLRPSTKRSTSYTIINLYIILKICEKILSFDNKKIENSNQIILAFSKELKSALTCGST